MITNAEINTTVLLEGLFRTIQRPYGYCVRVDRRKRDGTETIHIPLILHYIADEESKKTERTIDVNEKISVFFEKELQPLYRITEYRYYYKGKWITWVSAKFAKKVSPDEWKKYPYYGRHVINEIS